MQVIVEQRKRSDSVVKTCLPSCIVVHFMMYIRTYMDTFIFTIRT